ncbi:unnamed protein product [Adineta ricciae]|uniref:HIT-type domain-containing protein n=1 Tax=Adineta ricciae TaxID=249248 RepID=A0A813N613_ADIRI|nr:unnamed protein product [Adineta ricciae]CAF1498126.1 unnamed protein product [Adineta ricciae]
MPSTPPVLIIGVNPIVRVVVPLLRAFGFQINHLWSPYRLTSDLVALCKDTLNIELSSCSTLSFDQLLDNATQPYLIFICTDADQHLALIKRITSPSIIKPCHHHVICMPPFNVDPKSLISVQQVQQQLCCYCYPIGFLPTFIKLKRFLIEEQANIGNVQSIEFRIQCCSLKSCSDDRINSSLLNRFGSFALSILFYLFGTQTLSTISHAYIQSPNETTCSFHINYNRSTRLPPVFVNIISNSHISSTYNQELIIVASKCALLVNDYRLILRRFNTEDQILIDSFHSDTNEKFADFSKENPEIPLIFIQSFYYFIGHLKESLINQIPRSTFTELTSFDIVYKVQEAIVAIREAARTGEIVPITRDNKTMQCQVCDENKNTPYKCPTCRIRYCSLSCCQTHKSSDTCTAINTQSKSTEEIPMTQIQLPIELGDDEESDRLPSHMLERIGQSVQILDLLKNRHLRAMIKSLDSSISPADDMQKAMMEPIFVQFVDELLKVVESNTKL